MLVHPTSPVTIGARVSPELQEAILAAAEQEGALYSHYIRRRMAEAVFEDTGRETPERTAEDPATDSNLAT